MRRGVILLSAVHLLIALMLLCLGALFIGFASSPFLRKSLLDFLEIQSFFYLTSGVSLISLSFFLFACFYALYKKTYLTVQMSSFPCSIDEALIHSYVQDCLTKVFPGQNIESEVVVHRKRKIQIIAYFPPHILPKRAQSLKEIEKQLGKTFQNTLGYKQDFQFTVIAAS